MAQTPIGGRGRVPAGISSRQQGNLLTTASAMQPRRDQQSSQWMASLLALALAVSTFAVPARATTSGISPCCLRMGGHCPVVALQCCGPEEPDRPLPTPPPSGQTAPTPDLTPLIPAASVIPAPVAPAEPPVLSLRQLVDPLPLYLLHATLLV